MGKLVLEIPGMIDMKLKTRNISEAIRKLTHLRKTDSKQKNIFKGIRKFKGIAKYREMERPKDEWYYQ
jgi:hypothetical protein